MQLSGNMKIFTKLLAARHAFPIRFSPCKMPWPWARQICGISFDCLVREFLGLLSPARLDKIYSLLTRLTYSLLIQSSDTLTHSLFPQALLNRCWMLAAQAK